MMRKLGRQLSVLAPTMAITLLRVSSERKKSGE
jgi:hypothetical protein